MVPPIITSCPVALFCFVKSSSSMTLLASCVPLDWCDFISLVTAFYPVGFHSGEFGGIRRVTRPKVNGSSWQTLFRCPPLGSCGAGTPTSLHHSTRPLRAAFPSGQATACAANARACWKSIPPELSASPFVDIFTTAPVPGARDSSVAFKGSRKSVSRSGALINFSVVLACLALAISTCS